MRFVIIAALFMGTLYANLSENEALALRRIADFWEEGEYQIAKNQMELFLEEFPESSYKNRLSSALGDLFLREKSYQTALKFYAQVDEPALIEKIFLHRMQCLYHLEWHATLADECEAYLQNDDIDAANRLEASYLLAIALYSQITAPQKEAEAVIRLAERAKPYFELLSQTELSEEVAGAFAHLQCILKDYKGASQIYLDLAKKGEKSEEYLFQAALIQSKYDPTLALQTFDQLASVEGGEFAKEASYNLLILYFEQGRHEEIISEKEKFFNAVSPEKRNLCSFFVGQSYLHLKRYEEASSELSSFLKSDIPEDRVRPTLLFLVEAAYQSTNLELLDTTLERLDKSDPERPKALFCRALTLKKQGKLAEAKEALLSLLSSTAQFADRAQVSLALAQFYFEEKNWKRAREAAFQFINEFGAHEIAKNGWDLLLAASNEIGDKTQFIQDLRERLKSAPDSEKDEWIFRLAKAHFELNEMDEAALLLEPIQERHINAKLLLAFSYRDGQGDEENFCFWGEKALEGKATLLPIFQQHIGLFNSYLKQDKLDAAADHLYAALLESGSLQPANLFWLADIYYSRYEKDPLYASAALDILSRLPLTPLEEAEPFILKLAKLHRHFGKEKLSQELLEMLEKEYNAFPENPWNHDKEVRYYLAKSYLALNEIEKATEIFEKLATTEMYHNRFVASAALESVRLLGKNETDFEKSACRLKNLVLQKKLEHEPIYLEAALEYVDLLSQKDPSKRPFFVEKMKTGFESEEDLLSKDYHAAFEKYPAQEKIYRTYIRYLEAELLCQEKSLHTKAKEILLQIKEEADEPLLSRVESLLETI